jgi:hypothetical protein
MVVHSEFKLYLNLPLNLGMKLGKENRIKKKENTTLALGPKVFAGGPFPLFPCSRQPTQTMRTDPCIPSCFLGTPLMTCGPHLSPYSTRWDRLLHVLGCGLIGQPWLCPAPLTCGPWSSGLSFPRGSCLSATDACLATNSQQNAAKLPGNLGLRMRGLYPPVL